MTCANVAALTDLLGHEYGEEAGENAALIRNIWKAEDESEREALWEEGFDRARRFFYHPDLASFKRQMIDWINNTHGVEYLGRLKRGGQDVYYCNAGDPYVATVVFVGPHLRVSNWGDLVEAGRVHEHRRF